MITNQFSAAMTIVTDVAVRVFFIVRLYSLVAFALVCDISLILLYFFIRLADLGIYGETNSVAEYMDVWIRRLCETIFRV